MTIDTTGLLEPQFKHVQRLVDSLYINGFALDMSETGTGKTYAAAAVAREMNCPLVLICPKAVIPQWTKVLKSFNLSPLVAINYEKIGRGNTKYMKWKQLQNLYKPWNEAAKDERPHFTFPKDSLVILDEGHRCKGAHSSNSQMMISLAEQGYKVLVSSATLATTPLEMKAVGYLSKLHKLYNFTDFCKAHGAITLPQYGALTFDLASENARQGMLALNTCLFEERNCASRLTVEDFGDLFPESHIVADAYDLGANSAKVQLAYEEMEAEIAKLDERTADYSQHIFAIMMEARRKSELFKVPLFVEMVEDLYDEGKSVVLFLNFQDSVDAVVSRLKKIGKFDDQIGYIVGSQHPKERQADIDAFNADKKRIMIANIKAGGIGISMHDLHGNHPRASIISPNFSAFELVQALGRVWRQGGKTKSYQNIVFAAGTIEEKACRRVQSRIDNLSMLNDADLADGIQIFA
jgi:superfamily II DNA or RNA helicase